MIFRIIQFIMDLFRNVSLGASRSNQWPKVRSEFINNNPNCAVCGSRGKLLRPNEVHHIKVFHLNPQDELNSQNLITLCRDHHLLIGHLMSWKSWNEEVEKDAKIWHNKIINRPTQKVVQ